MLAQDLIQLGRTRYLDDVSDTGLLWEDDELLAGLNWAHNRAVEWGLLLRDTDTAAICHLTTVENQPTYSLDKRIVTVESATLVDLAGVEYDLPAMARKDLLWTFGPSWRVDTGKPQAYEPTQSYQIRLVPLPDFEWAGMTVRLDVNRLPLKDMTLTDSPEIPERMQENLLFGMCHQAFLKRDADANQLDLSDQFLKLFIGYFGPPSSHVDRMHRLKEGEQEQDIKRRGVVAPWRPNIPVSTPQEGQQP